ncbi:MAG: MBOAT family O-acyltransferase [Bacteroidia bacterium]|nr:MBOAT family O-acyltransferase [Bacteroidia bacterium]
MLFNSLHFLVFLVLVLSAYYGLPHRLRWLLLLLASLYFYMVWNPVYILLLLAATSVDYLGAYRMSMLPDPAARRPWLILSMSLNLGILFTFKYFNFISRSVTGLAQQFDPGFEGVVHELILPMGISFYTFQAMSYAIDVYRGELKAERHAGMYFLFITFFPQLVAGPIERAGNLLGQLRKHVQFDYARFTSGIRQAAWGMFKKVVIADRLAPMVNEVYNAPEEYTGVSLALATFLFAYQIYCDFSGYSDIALGTARMLGIDLMDNFNRPYYAKSITEFWRRWHISLSTWFRDYVYIPLGGNRVVKWRWYYNLFITFLVSGIWHGANWTFVIWGALHGLYIVAEQAVRLPAFRGRLWDALRVGWVFVLVGISWVFFRANTVSDAWLILGRMIGGIPESLALLRSDPVKHLYLGQDSGYFLISVFAVACLEAVQLMQRRQGVRYFFEDRPAWFRWSFYAALLLMMIFFGMYHDKSEFIYFQF